MALGVEQQVAWLQVSMQQVGGVHVLQALENLVDDVLLMDLFQDVGTDDSMEVGIHEVENEIDISVVFRPDDVLQSDDVLVADELLQEDDLTERPLRISRVLEGVEVLLESNNLFSALVNSFPDDAVGTLAKLLQNFVLS